MRIRLDENVLKIVVLMRKSRLVTIEMGSFAPLCDPLQYLQAPDQRFDAVVSLFNVPFRATLPYWSQYGNVARIWTGICLVGEHA